MSAPGDDINPDALDRRRAISTVVGTVGALLVIVLMIGVMLYATHDNVPDDHAQREAKLVELRGGETKAQTEYGWIDKSKGTVRLPIDVAMDKVLAEGFKLPTTAPATAPAKAPAPAKK